MCNRAYTSVSTTQLKGGGGTMGEPFGHCPPEESRGNRFLLCPTGVPYPLSEMEELVSPLVSMVLILFCASFPLQETYLMKHMRKHNIPDPQQQVAVVQAQVQAQSQASQQQQHFQAQGSGAAGGPSGENPSHPPPQCSFDLTPYKTSEHHKDICLTVSTSTIQVEHLSSS